MQDKQIKRYKRHKRIRAKIRGTAKVPRFCIFRSNKHIYGQLIDDKKGKTLVAVGDLELKSKNKKVPRSPQATGIPAQKDLGKKKTQKPLSGKAAIAYQVGQLIAKKALAKKIERVVFDRGGYKYHGRVKALAEGARRGGLQF